MLFRKWNDLKIQYFFGAVIDSGILIVLLWILLPYILTNIAKIFTEKGKYDYSIKICDFCINHLKDFYWAHVINGYNLTETENYEKAIIALKKCLTYDTDSNSKCTIYTELGANYLNKEEYEKSLCCYEKACESELDEVLAYAIKGKILSLIGLERYGEAKDCIEENPEIFENDENILSLKEHLKEELN